MVMEVSHLDCDKVNAANDKVSGWSWLVREQFTPCDSLFQIGRHNEIDPFGLC